MNSHPSPFSSVDEAQKRLRDAGYIADREIAVVAHLAGALGKPLLLEGPAGVGKTELAKALARGLGRELVRLQCYEGLDESKALYEWEYGKQLLYTQLVRDVLGGVVAGATSVSDAVERVASQEAAFFHERFLLARPLLQALRSEKPVVLLIDEVDRSDPEFEAMLLEILSDFQVTIPELGTIRAKAHPFVVLTSNATRELTEALRRRCLHLFLDYPTAQRELAIVQLHVPEASEALAKQVVAVAESVRDLALRKAPSVSEVIDWTRSLVLLGAQALTPELLRDTLSALAKHTDDKEKILDRANQTLRKV
ncbi:MAG: MoxR family ATPase [Sandaracinaceae bacterium]|jgi:MoxR-like ATPase|nr:MoxR family ATPase [Sandaracinaceae bacterium]